MSYPTSGRVQRMRSHAHKAIRGFLLSPILALATLSNLHRCLSNSNRWRQGVLLFMCLCSILGFFSFLSLLLPLLSNNFAIMSHHCDWELLRLFDNSLKPLLVHIRNQLLGRLTFGAGVHLQLLLEVAEHLVELRIRTLFGFLLLLVPSLAFPFLLRLLSRVRCSIFGIIFFVGFFFELLSDFNSGLFNISFDSIPVLFLFHKL